MKKNKRFGYNFILTISFLVGLLGFGLGFNWTKIQTSVLDDRKENIQTGIPEDLDYTQLEHIYDQLREKFAGDLDVDKLLEGAKAGLVSSTGDPYTQYFDAEAAKQFQESLDGTFSGIGAEISIRDEQLIVVAPLEGSPAQTAGILASDLILAINDESTASMSIETAVSKIRGKEGTEVVLTISRGRQQPRDITIVRDVIKIPSVTSEMKEGNVAHIKITRFGPGTYEDFKKEAQNLKNQGAKKIILDMRNNPGGLLDTAVDIADEFLDNGDIIVEEKKDDVLIESLKAKRGGILLGMPTVVLINEGSASASEIIAGALQENKVAKVVGMRSFGKGSVQELVELDDGNLLKVTVALWYTPQGRNITKEGIEPDLSIELSEEDIKIEKDSQLVKALELLNNQAP